MHRTTICSTSMALFGEHCLMQTLTNSQKESKVFKNELLSKKGIYRANYSKKECSNASKNLEKGSDKIF